MTILLVLLAVGIFIWLIRKERQEGRRELEQLARPQVVVEEFSDWDWPPKPPPYPVARTHLEGKP